MNKQFVYYWNICSINPKGYSNPKMIVHAKPLKHISLITQPFNNLFLWSFFFKQNISYLYILYSLNISFLFFYSI